MDIQRAYENRLKALEILVDNFMFNTEIFSQYYGISEKLTKTLFNQVYDADINKYQSDDPVSLETLIKNRNEYLNNAENREQALEDIGYWCEPYDELYKDIYSCFDKETAKRYVFSLSDNAKIIDKRNNLHDSNIMRLKEYLIKYREKDIINVFKNAKSNQETNKILFYLTGVNPTYYKEFRDIVRKHFESSLSNNKDSSYLKANMYKYNDRMEQVWQMYNTFGSTHGYTMQEIAYKFGVTRATIVSDIKAYKKLHPEAIDNTQLYRQRHAGSTKYKLREKEKKKVVNLFESGMSQNSIATKTGINANRVHLYLVEAGKLHTIDDLHIKSLKEGLKHKGQFTEDSKDNRSKKYNSYKHHGSTPYLLDKKRAPLPSENPFDRNKIRAGILTEQRENMAILRNNPDFKDKLFESDGKITKAKKALALEKKKQKELENENDFDIEK